MNLSGRSVSALWSRAVAEPPGDVAFMVEEAGRWRSVGWQEAGRRVEELAAGFLVLGVRPGDRVAILGRTRLEWTLADFALISTGAIVVPVYPAATPADRAHVLSHSATRMLVCEDVAERERIARLPGLGHLERIFTMDDSDDGLVRLGERGRHHLRRDPGAVARARAAIREEHVLTLVYTSGTTGPPKGCLLTHRNYGAMVNMTRRVHGLVQPGDVVLLDLPLAHVFARLVQFLVPAVGMTLAFCPDASRLGIALRAVRPTLLPSVPKLFEAMHAAVLRDLARARGPRRVLVGAALRAGRQAAGRRREGRRLDPWLALRLRLADRLVSSRIRSRLRWQAAARGVGRREAPSGGGGAVRGAGHPDPRGLRPDRVHDRGGRQPAGPSPCRYGRPAPSRGRGEGRRRRGDPGAGGERVRRLPPRRGGDTRGPGRGGLARGPATWGSSTPTAS